MTVTAEMVKQLREATGAAILDCKKALEQAEGDLEKAKAYLEEKGLAIARKKAERAAFEGKIETYTHHGGRVGVMLEVNCETDFVANTDQFQAFIHELALHIAFAAPQYMTREDVPEEILADIAEDEIDSFYQEACLLEQPFIRDDSLTIGDLLIRTVAELRENIVIRRFSRYELGEHADTE